MDRASSASPPNVRLSTSAPDGDELAFEVDLEAAGRRLRVGAQALQRLRFHDATGAADVEVDGHAVGHDAKRHEAVMRSAAGVGGHELERIRAFVTVRLV